MTALMSTDAFETEQEHIREQVTESADALAKRQTKWTVGSVIGLIVTLFAFAAGLVMIAAGDLPESVSVGTVDVGDTLALNIPTETVINGVGRQNGKAVDPKLADLVKTFESGGMSTLLRVISMAMIVVGVALGVAQQSLMPFIMGIGGGLAMNHFPSVLGAVAGVDVKNGSANESRKAIQPLWAGDLKRAVERKDWQKVRNLAQIHDIDPTVMDMASLDRLAATKSLNDAIRNERFEEALQISKKPVMSGLDDLANLQSRLHHHLGHHAQAAELVREHQLFNQNEDAAWFIENAWTEADDQGFMSDASSAYYSQKLALVEKGTFSLWLSGLMLVLTIIAGLIMADLGRNLRKLDDWLKASGDNGADEPANGRKTAYPEPPHPPSARTTA